jgi:glycosyltransferase involved in cell wall biosynthesis
MYDATNIGNWSGLGYFIGKTLQQYVGKVTFIGNLKSGRFARHYMRKMIHRITDGREFCTERTADAGVFYAEQVDRQLKDGAFDLVFAAATIPVAYMRSAIPLLIYTDATFASMVGYYFNDLSDESIGDGNTMESLAQQKASRVLYASNWAAHSAIHDYGIHPAKVEVAPFGANIQEIPNWHKRRRSLDNPLSLLFVGKEWKRKGGTVAYEVVKILHSKGINSVLHVFGCEPEDIQDDLLVRRHGSLDKKKPSEARRMSELFSSADFLILPSEAECFGIVICEAFAHGVPVLAHRTGGIPTLVANQKNGFLSATNQAEEYSDFISGIIGTRRYQDLRQGARASFETRFNWDAAGRKIYALVKSLLK